MNDRHLQNGAATSRDEERQAQLTAYALGQLEGEELAQVEAWLQSPEGAGSRLQIESTRRLATALNAARAKDNLLTASPALRSEVLRSLDAGENAMHENTSEPVELASKTSVKRPRWLTVVVSGGVLSLLVGLIALPWLLNRQSGEQLADSRWSDDVLSSRSAPAAAQPRWTSEEASTEPAGATTATPGIMAGEPIASPHPYNESAIGGGEAPAVDFATPRIHDPTAYGISPARGRGEAEVTLAQKMPAPHAGRPIQLHDSPPADGPAPSLPAITAGAIKNNAPEDRELSGQQPRGLERQLVEAEVLAKPATRIFREGRWYDSDRDGVHQLSLVPGTEQYDPIVENSFLASTHHPLSTFSIDVDTASYANVRRFLTSGRLPPPNAVRIEELVNYFSYDYPQPKAGEPFSVNLEMAECPWQEGHRLLRVGIKGKDIHRQERPQSNLVFLLDVSGSMDEPNKLPLVKQSMSMLVQELAENDRVSIVTYAGNAGLVLSPTSGDQKRRILDAIESLTPGGSTHGSAGIQLAYDLAAEYFREKGTNRVILATDGDLNVGVTNDDALVELIKEKAQGGTFLTVLGFGEGNLKDSKMEKLADNGNGIYAYIDGAREGRKVLVEQMTGSLITIAKDVKIQIEFNPAEVASYRLLGYENRILAAQDFNDDKKDAGEIGAGHSVTALYEIVPVGAEAAVKKAKEEMPGTDPLKYQQSGKSETGDETADATKANADKRLTEAAQSGELLTLKLRYKEPDGDTSKLLEYPLKDKGGSFNSASKEMQFASAVASFGMVLRQSEHRGTSNLAAVEEIAQGALGKDDGGYRAEFLNLVKQAGAMGLK